MSARRPEVVQVFVQERGEGANKDTHLLQLCRVVQRSFDEDSSCAKFVLALLLLHDRVVFVEAVHDYKAGRRRWDNSASPSFSMTPLTKT